MKKPELLLILSRALASDHGICIETNEPEKLRTKLYNARKNQQEFANLSLVISPSAPTTELWIVKRHAN